MAKMALGMAELSTISGSYDTLRPSIHWKTLLKTPQAQPKPLQGAEQAHTSLVSMGRRDPTAPWLGGLCETLLRWDQEPFPFHP